MDGKSNLSTGQTLKNIRSHFDFLFRRGFRITSVLFVGKSDEKWQIVLTDGYHFIQFHGNAERVSLALSSLDLYEVGFFGLYDLIRLMERDENGLPVPGAPPPDALSDVTEIAGLLEKHLDDMLRLMDRIYQWVSNSEARAIDLNNARAFY